MSEKDKQPVGTQDDKLYLFLKDLLKTAIISFLLVFLLTQFIVRPVRVEGRSMEPTLKNNELGFSNIIGLKLNGISRFDVVIVYVPQANEYLVKRVIGLPGESITYQNDVLYVNGEAVDEPFLDEAKATFYADGNNQGLNYTDFYDLGTVTLAANTYFLLGDNRPNSSDSRRYGAFSRDAIVAKDVFIIWPLDQFEYVR